MYSYKLPEFKFPVFNVSFDPISKRLYDQANKIEIDQIEKILKKQEHIILDFNRDHSNFIFGPTSVLDAYNYFTSLGFSNIFYLTSENVQNNPFVKFFPTWLYSKHHTYQDVNFKLQQKRKYPVSCLNRFPSPHRVYFFYHLLNKPYFEQCLTSFIGLSNPYNNFLDVGAYNEIYRDIPDNIKQFYETTKYVKKTDSDINNWNELHDPTYKAFADTYLNIITESTYYHSFFTEKTAKPLVTEQLFIMLGGQNSITNLKQLGFEVFDDLLNSDYDSQVDWKIRADMVLKLLDNVFYNIEDIFNHYTKQRQHNKKYFLSDSFKHKCLQQVEDLLK